MVGFGRFLCALAAMSVLLVVASLHAQSTEDDASGPSGKVRLVPRPKEPTPFSVAQPASASANTIEFIPASQMSQSDQLIASNAQSSIAEHALINGFELSEGEWTYQQIACPAFPGHLFLRYTRNNGAIDLTVFSASIPRGQEGRVRIIPILKRSYSLFAPAPINALTISAFNHIRAEESERDSSNWLGNGLCYAALAGADPQLPPSDPQPRLGEPIPTLNAVLQTDPKGGGIIRFVDAAATPRAMEWSMTFNEKGKLVKATHKPASMITPHPVPETSAVGDVRPVPQTAK
jgi:hypothetical protein